MMQKHPWKLAAGLVAATAIMVGAVQAVEVTSNVVGYVKIDVTAGGNNLLSTPFDQVDGSDNLVSLVVGEQVAPGSVIFKYVADTYVGSTKFPAGWTNDFALNRGDGFWLRTTADASVLLMGEVPEEDTTLSLAAGNTLTGMTVPVEMTMDDSGLSAAPLGSTAFFWDGAAYVGATKFPAGWTPNAAVVPGEGFWVTAQGDFDWTEPAP